MAQGPGALSEEEYETLSNELNALMRVPIDEIAHRLNISHTTAEYIRALISSAIKEWEI